MNQMEQKKQQQEQETDLIYFDDIPETTHVSIFEMEDRKNKQLIDFMMNEVMTQVNAKMNAFEEKMREKDEEIQRLNAEMDQMKDTNKKLESTLINVKKVFDHKIIKKDEEIQGINYSLLRINNNLQKNNITNNLQLIGNEELCFQFRSIIQVDRRMEKSQFDEISMPQWHFYNYLRLSGDFIDKSKIIKLSLKMSLTDNVSCIENYIDEFKLLISRINQLFYPYDNKGPRDESRIQNINEVMTYPLTYHFGRHNNIYRLLLSVNYNTFNHPFIIMIELKNKIIYTHIYLLHLLFGWNIVIKNFRNDDYDVLSFLRENYLETSQNYQKIKSAVDRTQCDFINQQLMDDINTFNYYSDYVCDIEKLKNLLVMDGIECI
jgi:hypothetical protein